ncbi:hypothetical protein [Frankia sp. R82]|uniref:hypothetical protein n=1 Tax=Frankia sp. R82 TaxID=2950553 RepID=UPI002043D469|nr:hypothetical protein [Frankia sp. R82]MCM3887103.1 hypothetical protein [Frankia sp. R82]
MGTAFACTGSTSAAATRPPGVAQSGGTVVVASSVRAADTLAPSPADVSAIASAVKSSEYTSAVPANDYEVTGTVLAASDPTWAYTELHPTVEDYDRAEGVLHHTSGGWQLVQLGTYELGCGVAPADVLDDFGLECPPPGADDSTAEATAA